VIVRLVRRLWHRLGCRLDRERSATGLPLGRLFLAAAGERVDGFPGGEAALRGASGRRV